MHQDLAVVVENTDVHGAGMQVNAAVKLMLLGVEAQEILCREPGHNKAATVQLLLNFLHHSRRRKTMATTAMPRVAQETPYPPPRSLAFALGVHQWQRGFTTGAAQRPRARHVPARHLETVQEESRRAQHRCGFPAAARVVRGDEAGREGLWLPRGFVPQGGDHGVVASSRLAGQRRHRRAQTERLAGHQWRTRLLRHGAGARTVWRLVRVPRGEEAERRQRQRAWTTTKRERTRGLHRLQGLRAAPGLVRPPNGACPPPLAHRRRWEGSPLPAGLHHRRVQAWEHVHAVAPRRAQVDAARRAWRQTAEEAVRKTVPHLLTRTGMGTNRAWRWVRECCGWRACRQGQAGGARRGLTPTP
jgi:hypothetical protein